MKTTFSLLTLFSLGLVAFVAAEQDANVEATADRPVIENQETVDTPTEAIRVSLSEDGVLSGQVFTNEDDRQQPVAAKVTISTLTGDTVASETTDEDGSFEFEAIEPGYYTIIGVGPGYFGDQTVDVTSFGDSYAATVPVPVTKAVAPAAVFASHPTAPVAAMSTDVVEWYPSTGGGGGVPARGGGLRRLLPFVGLVGLVGLAGDDDASPDE